MGILKRTLKKVIIGRNKTKKMRYKKYKLDLYTHFTKQKYIETYHNGIYVIKTNKPKH